ncbi:hypothetical protein ACC841_36365, partial [Rhizobium ruizarguesonis]
MIDNGDLHGSALTKKRRRWRHYSEDHKLRDARTELHAGQLVTPFEEPFRAEWILAAVKEAGFTDVVAPDA